MRKRGTSPRSAGNTGGWYFDRRVGIGFTALIFPVFLPLSALCDEGVSWTFDTSGTVETEEAQPVRGVKTVVAQDLGDQPYVTIQFQADTPTEVVTEPTISGQSAGQTLATSLATPVGGALSPTTSEPKPGRRPGPHLEPNAYIVMKLRRSSAVQALASCWAVLDIGM